jgi:hypothetical protein
MTPPPPPPVLRDEGPSGSRPAPPARPTTTAAPARLLAAALALPLLAALAGCDTRVVDLIRTPDGGSSSSVICNEFVRDDGVTCRICFDGSGAATAIFCPQAPDAGTTPVPPAAGTCKVTVAGDDRCALCPSPMGGTLMTCLKCDPTPPGESCRVCVWSDNPNARCRQCIAPDGTRNDGCDGLRTEMLIYPQPQPDTGMAP